MQSSHYSTQSVSVSFSLQKDECRHGSREASLHSCKLWIIFYLGKINVNSAIDINLIFNAV